MKKNHPTKWMKLKWSLPWLRRYPLWRMSELIRRLQNDVKPKHLIFVVANHFEPGWNGNRNKVSLQEQIARAISWRKKAKRISQTLKDSEGHPFRHTYFYPIEQYDREVLDILAEMQAENLGDVEVHLHHGVDKPDTAENTRRILVEMRDRFAEEHKLLARMEGVNHPVYAFVHGNLALANSAGGKYCGVDSEMQILADTGCYVDMTLPSAPDISQVPMLNAIYECDNPLDETAPHRSGRNLQAGQGRVNLPFIFTGPLVFNWTERVRGMFAPRLDDGVLAENQSMDMARFNRWQNAGISVHGKEDWVFVKLYCHGFFEQDRDSMIGERASAFFNEVIENGEQSGDYKVHFATAREASNMVFAAVEGKEGSPGKYRDFVLKPIMQSVSKVIAKASAFAAFMDLIIATI